MMLVSKMRLGRAHGGQCTAVCSVDWQQAGYSTCAGLGSESAGDLVRAKRTSRCCPVFMPLVGSLGKRFRCAARGWSLAVVTPRPSTAISHGVGGVAGFVEDAILA